MMPTRKNIQTSGCDRERASSTDKHLIANTIDDISSTESKPTMDVATTTIGGKPTQIFVKNNQSHATDNNSHSAGLLKTTSSNVAEQDHHTKSYESTNTEATDDNCNRDENEVKKMRHDDMGWCTVANKMYKDYLETNINPISFTGKNKITSTANGLTEAKKGTHELERVIDPSLYCRHCKQLNDHCHFKVFGDYIQKKLFFNYANKTDYPGKIQIYKECKEAYNEMRRVVFYQKFHFYDGAEVDLPYCLICLQYDMEDMIKHLVRATNINNQTMRGVVHCIRAKRSRQA